MKQIASNDKKIAAQIPWSGTVRRNIGGSITETSREGSTGLYGTFLAINIPVKSHYVTSNDKRRQLDRRGIDKDRYLQGQLQCQ